MLTQNFISRSPNRLLVILRSNISNITFFGGGGKYHMIVLVFLNTCIGYRDSDISEPWKG